MSVPVQISLLRSPVLFRTVLLLLIIALVPLGGCKPPVGGDVPERVTPPVRQSPLDEAKNAYVKGDYAKAETLALRLVKGSSLSGADAAEAGRVLAAAALQNRHPSVAITGLEAWRAASTSADSSKEWQDAWCKALRSLSSHDARTRANQVYQDGGRSHIVRSIAGVFLAVRQWKDGELGQSMTALENIYTSAGSTSDKAAIERRLALELHLAPQAASRLAATTVTEENKGTFPYSIITVDQLRRQSQKAETRDTAQAALAALPGQISLADPSLFKSPPSESSIEIQGGAAIIPSGPVSGQPVVLALPLSGQYGAISEKIVAGAQAACDEAGKASLIVVDTEQADWISRINGLPAEATVVGGPLRRSDYNKLKSQGVIGNRAVFAFLPSLESGDEGRVAWRFFSSAQDQVDTLLRFTSGLGINGYGVFYPQDNFGQRMADLFEQRAKGAGAANVFKQSYDGSDQSGWMVAAGGLLQHNKSGKAFRAIFLPDTWKNMDSIVPNFFYNDETRQVLMGTSLWEQGLGSGSFVSMQYYGLAVFPGAWNASSPGAQKLQSALSASGKSADFWAALGYDFARMSMGLGVQQGFAPNAVNAALQTVSTPWSMAPISWNNGVASQQMFLFTPQENGFAPVNESQFKAAFEEAWR